MNTVSRAAVTVACIALAAFGVAQAAPSTNPDAVQAGTYKADPAHTRVLFSVLHMGFTHYYGDFSGVSGTLSLDPKHVGGARVQVTIPTASVSTTNPKLDGELKGGEWLNAAADPTITFVSTHVSRTGPTTATIDGDLTLHGVTRPVSLNATFNAAGPNALSHKYTVGFDAVGHLNRSDFGVKTDVPLISDRVDIIISAAFERTE